jgi:hypothetical protein
VITTATGRPSVAWIRPARSAATPTAPEASATTWSCASSATIASAISSSLTRTSSSTSARCANTRSPIPPAIPSAIVGPAGYSRIAWPRFSDSRYDGDASACTPTMRMVGSIALAAIATDAISPPPPIGTTIVPTSGRWDRISRPIVPWPAAVAGSSKAWT